jgi:hypothetical protein
MPMLYAMHRSRACRAYGHRIPVSGDKLKHVRKLLALKLLVAAAGSRWTLVLKGLKMRNRGRTAGGRTLSLIKNIK